MSDFATYSRSTVLLVCIARGARMAVVVERASVLAGAVRFKDEGIPNLGATYHGQILLPSGEIRLAIIKDLPLRELANEVFGAALALHLGMPVPQPFVAFATMTELPMQFAPTVPGGYVVFASADASAPSISQIVIKRNVPDGAALSRIAAAIAHSGLAGGFYGFDAWSANVDRHLGNILFGGPKACWLIDHGRCFTGAEWSIADLQPAEIYINRLKIWLTPMLGEAEKDALLAEVEAFCSLLSGLDVHAIGADNMVPALLGRSDFEALVSFLGERIQHSRRISADALNRLA